MGAGVQGPRNVYLVEIISLRIDVSKDAFQVKGKLLQTFSRDEARIIYHRFLFF